MRSKCVITMTDRYNIFSMLGYDKYGSSQIENNDDIESISKILCSCKVYDFKCEMEKIKRKALNYQFYLTI